MRASARQHQRDDGRSEEHAAVGRLRVEAHTGRQCWPPIVAVRRDQCAQVGAQPILRRADSSVGCADASVRLSAALRRLAKPGVPASHRAHEPGHAVSGVRLDEVGMRVRVDLPVRRGAHTHTRTACLIVLLCSRRGPLDPLVITSLAELVRPPDGQLQPD